MAEEPRETNFLTSKKLDTNWIFGMGLAMGLGLVVMILMGAANPGFGRWSAIMGGLLLAGSMGMIGGFIGFLFGIPRSKQQTAAPAKDGENGDREYLENTNLEQISDWLTKIIVGLTLVQFNQIAAVVMQAGEKLAPVLVFSAAPAVGQAIAVTAILYFFIVGFLFGYLWTRIFMEYVLRRQSVATALEFEHMMQVRQEKENDANAEALSLVDGYLDPKADVTAPHFGDIEEKISASSLIARTLIFEKARDTRRKSWDDETSRVQVDRTIPVFKGLIKAEPEKYHRNYGQLGYALVRATKPDWAGAKAALEKAIALRGPGNDTGTAYYEFNLALALIHLDGGFAAGKPSTPEAAKEIKALLDLGRTVIALREEKAIVEWAKLNGYKL